MCGRNLQINNPVILGDEWREFRGEYNTTDIYFEK